MNVNRASVVLLHLSLAVTVVGCRVLRSAAKVPASDVLAAETAAVAAVDGVPVSLERFNLLFQQRTPGAVIGGPISQEGAFRLKHQLARELIDELLVAREARRQGVLADSLHLAAAVAAAALKPSAMPPATSTPRAWIRRSLQPCRAFQWSVLR